MTGGRPATAATQHSSRWWRSTRGGSLCFVEPGRLVTSRRSAAQLDAIGKRRRVPVRGGSLAGRAATVAEALENGAQDCPPTLRYRRVPPWRVPPTPQPRVSLSSPRLLSGA